MLNEESSVSISRTDEEWNEALRNLRDVKMVAYLRSVYETVSQNPMAYPSIMPEMLEQMLETTQNFERSVHRTKLTDRSTAIARSRFERTADRILESMDGIERGN
jgi:preprotein translocase subunit SecA